MKFQQNLPQWLPIARKKQPCSLGITLSSGVLTFFEIWLRTYWFYDVISPMLHLKTKVQYEIIRFCTSAPSFQNVFLKAKLETWQSFKVFRFKWDHRFSYKLLAQILITHYINMRQGYLLVYKILTLILISIYWPISAQCSILYPLKRSENQSFSNAFRGYRNETLGYMC